MIRARRDARRPARLITLSAVLSVASVALAAVPALAADPDPTTTTAPPEETTTTTLPPEETTTTTLPPEETTTTLPPEETTTTLPPEDTTTTTEPGEEDGDLTPDEELEPEPAFAHLTSSQRAALLQLQAVSDTLATRHFALVDLEHQLAAAKNELKEARARETALAEREVTSLVAALDRNDEATTPSPSELDALWRSFESERKGAKRARVQAQASVTDLSALVDELTQAVADSTAARDDAEASVIRALGSTAGLRPGPDDISALLAARQAGQPDPIALAGFAMPIAGARLGSPFGIRIDPLGGGGGFHAGLDFDAFSGTPIHAAAAGVVVIARDCGGYGYCVVIDHGSSLGTLYGHQSKLLTQVGDQVEIGQVIGLVGSTGKSTGPHLHFEVRFHGLPIDALPTLTA